MVLGGIERNPQRLSAVVGDQTQSSYREGNVTKSSPRRVNNNGSLYYEQQLRSVSPAQTGSFMRNASRGDHNIKLVVSSLPVSLTNDHTRESNVVRYLLQTAQRVSSRPSSSKDLRLTWEFRTTIAIDDT